MRYIAQTYESVVVGAAAVGLTPATLLLPNGSQVQEVSGRLETAQIRFRYDGVDPTAAEGHLLEIGDWITIRGIENIQRWRGIRTGAVSGVLKFTCSGGR